MRTLAVLATTALLALAGCGGDDSDDSKTDTARGYDSGTASTTATGGDEASAVTDVMNQYFAALSDGDGEKACSYLSDDGRSKIEELSGGTGCAEIVSQGVETTGKEPYESVDLDDPVVSGDSATVHYTIQVQGKDVEADQTLVKDGDDWKLEASSPPGG